MASLALYFAVLAMATSSLASAAGGGGGFSIDLIHRDSAKSPFHNPAATRFDIARAAAHRSARSISARTTSYGSIVSKVVPDDVEYLMELYLGTPAFKFMAIVDTGSDLIWTNCKPCNQCYTQIPPLFDSLSSSSYRTLGCDTQFCASLPSQDCGTNSTCLYHYGYGDSSGVDGVLSTETFTFDTTSGKSVSVPNVTFGCNSVSQGTFRNTTSGMVGLGVGQISLVAQLGDSIDHKFAYCLVPLSDTQASSRLSFGPAAVFSGSGELTTPLIIEDLFYYMSLSEISVGGQNITVPGRPSGKGNIVLDSGTTLTILHESLVADLVTALSGVVGLPKLNDPDGELPLCFNVSGAPGGGAVPNITFKFEGAAVELRPTNMFLEVAQDVMCLAVEASLAEDIQIFGSVAQQSFHVGYDLSVLQVKFAATDCTKSS